MWQGRFLDLVCLFVGFTSVNLLLVWNLRPCMAFLRLPLALPRSSGLPRSGSSWTQSKARHVEDLLRCRGHAASRRRPALMQRHSFPASAELQPASPLHRALQMPGFPQARKLPEALQRTGYCVHVPALGSAASNTNLALSLLEDIQQAQGALRLHRSKRHLQIWGDRLMFSKTFTAVVARLVTLFDLTMVDCWVNVYRSGAEAKSPHHDNYQDRVPNPTVTLGLSLGSARDLLFQDVDTGEKYRVRQSNGDVFAFDSQFNMHFSHAIPAAEPNSDTGLRLSVILWCMEGSSMAVPCMTRRGRGFRIPEVVQWADWDLSDGLWSDSDALPLPPRS
eukprot:TRINITY_DN83848_c0_g1_i1.p1 TRINITY_DN83848_c0_g1~~TRINITY_DN83848_c0_g1_i1.p1  ORF type:complete len:348 (-),score=62.47 TRINITY_DN83848_c0_g1_i1:20-1024(-)